MPGFQGQVGDIGAQEAPAGGTLGHQAAGADGEHRRCGQLLAIANNRLPQPQLGCRAGPGVFVCRLVASMDWQVAGTPPPKTGIELHAQIAEGIDTQANGALGEAGLVVQQEALGPVLLVSTPVAAITAEVIVAQGQRELAVVQEAVSPGVLPIQE